MGVRADLREIGEEDFHDHGHILDVAPGQKVCRNCRTSTLPDYSRDYYENSENCRSKSLTKKMRILNPKFEESSILAEEARCYREIIDQLLEKLSNCENSRERYLLLSVLPKRWSAYQIQKIMGVSQATAKRAKELVENQGILCLVPSKSGKVLNPEVLKMIEDFHTSDDKSRIQPGKNDYVPVLITRERVEIQKRLLLCNLKECYQSF
ncbi:hypothetical protein QAD02_002102 [Eretmocerus hayati]|uniref:Uncharacterized protein n=1 Tax=Eretmocerus hayati TaxID=131215 RepID=A0ACC2NIX2_9HYME|nr:hypothetical protein QAD02_002102 [Eretmocerus hayati]